MDIFGYVWNGADRFEAGRNTEQLFKQGWPFPDYTWNTGSLPGWEFNANDDDEGWTNNGVSSSVVNGFYSAQLMLILWNLFGRKIKLFCQILPHLWKWISVF